MRTRGGGIAATFRPSPTMTAQPTPGSSTPAFVAELARFEDRVALVDEAGARLTYAELAARVDEAAEALGDTRRLVMVEVASAIDSVVAYLATLRGGHVALIAKPGDVAREGAIFATFSPSAVHEAGRPGFRILRDDDVALHPDLAALYSTSGSTGRAKLVRLSGANIQANADSIAEYLGIDEGEVAPTSLPLSYSYGASILSSHLSRGAALVLTEHSVVDPEFEALMRREGCTSLSGVPHTWKLIEQVGLLDKDLPALRTLTQAGGKMPAERVARIAEWATEHGKRLFVMYGQTECTARMAYLPWERCLERSDCIGVPIPGGAFRLVGEDGETIEEAGVSGELVYRGPNVMMGYAEEPADLAAPPGPDERFTGDLAERTEDGLYRIVGRLSRFSKILGLRISLDEVESIAKAAGYAEPIAAGDDTIVAVRVEDGADGAALEAHLAERCGVPADAVIAVALATVPRLDNGKVDYRSILAAASAIAEERQSATQSLRDELAGLLGADHIDDSETFASLGGDSLTYIQASFAIEKRLGHLPEGWEQLPISVLEAYESGGGPGAGASTRKEDPKASGGVWADMDVVLRAIAITFVTYNHTRPDSLPVAPGAMAVLLMAAGQSLARFRSESLFRGEGWSLIKSTFVRYMLPYLAVLLAYTALKREVHVPSLLLSSTFGEGPPGGFLEPYWFIEVFFHIALIIGVLFSIPLVRRAVGDRPFAWGCALFAALGLAHFVAISYDYGLPYLPLWSGIFMLGWCVHFARTRPQQLLLSATSLIMPWLTPRGLEVGVVLLIVIWIPRVPLLWEPIKTVLGKIAAASFQIYIFHTIVITAVRQIPGVPGTPLFPLLGVPLSVAAGVAISMLPAFRRLRAQRGASEPASSGDV